MNRLTDLDLARNQLTIIRQRTLAGLPSLENLELSANQIETIEDGALKLPALTHLRLGENKLRRLSESGNIFRLLPAVYTIYLHKNGLEYIGQSMQAVPNLQLLYLEQNLFRDLDLEAFAKLVSHFQQLHTMTKKY